LVTFDEILRVRVAAHMKIEDPRAGLTTRLQLTATDRNPPPRQNRAQLFAIMFATAAPNRSNRP